ncbi:CPBP family intramembrane metalloprotease [Flammeovirga sp. EKP202]|uniref:CPBP family intramembrane metalloprotease n=1 Tax=Flammeovirga sp. EKP202 TaxID=2770592 RepID=UPI00165F8B76|nr:CPBP family intramembrane metalloprotease [Flammeovirga sp. EKP202]MBD0400715.1 CPBP family intramembrane metalloprotease [Flammeovirga sp. EKP202]
MKQLITYFKDFHQNLYGPVTFLLIGLWAAFLIGVNYYFDIEDGYIDHINSLPLKGVAFFLYHLVGYLGVLVIIHWSTDRKVLTQNKDFWIKLTFVFIVLAAARSFFFHHYLVSGLDGYTKVYFFKVFSKARKVIIFFTGAIFLYFFFDKKELSHFYGLSLKAKNLRPYFILLALIAPFIIGASFTPSFQKFYPFVKYAYPEVMAKLYHFPKALFIVFYEMVYALEFFGVELFFRGVLIFGLTKFIGKDVVVPMAITYAVFHFGKPMGEAISSIFGGYILGVIAYYSKSLWGGIIIHIGIALLMEFFAYIQL